MTCIRALCLLTLLATAPCALGQAPDNPDQPDNLPPAGFWPTPLMMQRFIDRLVEDDIAKTYGLDEDQIQNTRALFQERFPQWLKENRPQLTQLTNEYFETLLGDGPPDPQYVADWAQRALPLVDGFADQVEAAGRDMSTYMTEQQRVILEGQLAAFRVGVHFVTQKLGSWSDGKFDPENDWIFYPEAKRRQRKHEKEMQEEMEAAKRDAMKTAQNVPSVQPSSPEYAEPRPTSGPAPDDWSRYVEDFIRRYQLDVEQRETAHKLLHSVQDQRERYLNISADRRAAAQRKLKAAKSDEQRAKAEKAMAKLTQPLERMFTVLKERLEPIPTRAQRQAAIDRQQGASPAPTTRPHESSSAGAKRESPSSP